MTTLIMQIKAAEFKAKCLKIMDHVKDYHEEVIITKHGKAVAKLVPIGNSEKKSIFALLKNNIEIKGDIIKPINESWNAEL